MSTKKAPTTENSESTALTAETLRQAITDHLAHSLGKAVQSAMKQDLYMALSLAVRDLLIDRWQRTTDEQYAANPKFVYYLSAEYMLGKQLSQNLLYTGTIPSASSRARTVARNPVNWLNTRA